MQQTTAAPAPDTKTYGALTVVAQVTTDGAYSINTFTGPIREHTLCLTTPDREVYRAAYRVIAEGGLAGVRPDGIHAALRDTLAGELHRVQRRTDAPSRNRVEAINRVLDQVDTPADREALNMIAARIRADRPTRPLSGLGLLKARYAADMKAGVA